jgi:hypothetical protein
MRDMSKMERLVRDIMNIEMREMHIRKDGTN